MATKNDHLNPKTGKIAAIGIIVVIILIAALVLFTGQTPAPPVLQEPLSIGISSPDLSALLFIAQEQGYFTGNGLNVTIKQYDTGLSAVNGLLTGEMDLATGSEYVFVGKTINGEKILITGNIAKFDNEYLIARKDRGIKNYSDLKGKKIGISKKTTNDFFLSRFLYLHGIDVKEVQSVDLKPQQMADAIVKGDVDAVLVWEPYANAIGKQLGTNALVWPAQEEQRKYWLVICRNETVLQNPALIEKMFRSLHQAEEFTYSHPVETKSIIKDQMHYDDQSVERFWQSTQFGLTLDQPLILAMEDEARWMAAQNMTGGKIPPSYLDMIYQNAMLEVKPQAVTIIR